MPRTATNPAPPDPAWLAARLEPWFAASGRDLPWRRDLAIQNDDVRGYRVLVAEAMLQQTQVSRVVQAYERFIERFPEARALAAAEERSVLACWQGLGYYRRARNLHAAAQMIVEVFEGRVPREVDDLRRLPGVGRYTAGAVASIAFEARTPLVDGNVTRVLARVHGIEAAPEQPATQQRIWALAEAGVQACAAPRAFNQALMELGATVCTPKSPACDAGCPLADRCTARRIGAVERIPLAKKRAERRRLWAYAVVVVTVDGAATRPRRARASRPESPKAGAPAPATGNERPPLLLLTRRPTTGAGLWAGLWEVPTLERDAPLPPPLFTAGPEDQGDGATEGPPSGRAGDVSSARAFLREWLRAEHGLEITPDDVLTHCGDFAHGTTQRDLRFSVYSVTVSATPPEGGEGTDAADRAGGSMVRPMIRPMVRAVVRATRDDLAAYPLSNAQHKVLRLAGFAV